MPRNSLLLVAAAVVAIGAVGILAWQALHEDAIPGQIEASGRIEGRITLVTPKVNGTVAALPVDEGQAVQAGALLVRLEEPTLLERRRSARARTAALERQLQAQRIDYDVAQRELPLKIAQARSALTETRARLAAARADRTQADTDAERLAALAARQLTSPQQAETARLRANVAAKTEQAARAAVTAATDTLALAQLGDRRLAALHEGIAGLERQVEQARAQAAEVDTQIGYLDISSPLSGVVLTRSVELGEHVAPGSPLFSLVNLDRLYLKVYVPEPLIGRVALGQSAEVRVDAYPDRAFPATVTKVATSAEFTPKNVETKEERVKLVFAVELSLTENPGGVLKPGMPADGRIDTGATAAQAHSGPGATTP
ncbi:HlyD family secretion protein [Immundisolibacter sp.]|uniref:HlyD family secretion protein n=1 Tax=Immundisolibacter sp. TaxID=1934948 RepID=UPI003F8346ED